MSKPKTPKSPQTSCGGGNIFGLGKLAQSSQVTFLPKVRVELLSNKQAVVEGCKGILEYSDTCIRLNADRLILKFSGHSLEMKCFTDNSAIIEGFLLSVEYQ